MRQNKMKTAVLGYAWVLALFAATATGLRAAPQEEPYLADADTMLLYHLDETGGSMASDSSGNDRHAKYGVGVTIGQPGMADFSAAANANGASNAVIHWADTGRGRSSFLYPAATWSFTFEAWVKLTNATFAAEAVVFAVQPSVGNKVDYRLTIEPRDDAFRPLGLVFRDSGADRASSGPLTWDTNMWYHVAVVVRQSGGRATYHIYRTPMHTTAAIAVASGIGDGITPAAGSDDRIISVGNYYAKDGSRCFRGLIDEVRYSSLARAAAEFKLTLGPSVIDRIRREALAPNNESDHALPVMGGWGAGVYAGVYHDDWYTPNWQIQTISQGHHLLPWFVIEGQMGEYAWVTNYYRAPLQQYAAWNLPVAFMTTQLESMFYNPAYDYCALPYAGNPNVWRAQDTYLSFAECRVLDATGANIALNKTASCSSFHSAGFEAGKGNDGADATSWHSVNPADKDAKPWWMVDLGSPCRIASIQIVTRQDYDQLDYRRNFTVQACNSNGFSSCTTLGSQGETPFPSRGVWTLAVSNSAAFRYVRVIRGAGGGATSQISPLGPTNQWVAAGYSVGASSLMRQLQKWYPNPPRVIFISNNEASKLAWTDAEQDRHYLDAHGTNRSNLYKLEVFAQGWIERYRAFQQGWRNGMTNANWKSNTIFSGYNAFGPYFFGRWGGWMTYSLYTTNRFDPNPAMWDGASVQCYLMPPPSGAVSDYQVWCPQVESMNSVFILNEAYRLNPNFWFESLYWRGCDTYPPKGGYGGNYGDILNSWPGGYTTDRYAGMVQFCMWLLRPRVARDYQEYASRAQEQPYFDAVMAAVDKIYTNSVLKSFWRSGQLVANTAHSHPYMECIPSECQSFNRMFMLDTPANPDGWWKQPVNLSAPLSVFALARVKGAAPRRQWLVYANAPCGARTNVPVTIPDCPVSVVLNPTVGGAFCLVDEQTRSVAPVR